MHWLLNLEAHFADHKGETHSNALGVEHMRLGLPTVGKRFNRPLGVELEAQSIDYRWREIYSTVLCIGHESCFIEC